MKILFSKGFTLLELMIVVAIVSILAAIAYPAYTSSVLKGKRAQARTALADLMQQQERYMTQKNCYFAFTNAAGVVTAAASSACGITASTPVPFKTFSGDSQASAAYQLSAGICPAAGSTTFLISECVQVIATPIKADPAVDVLRMTSTGIKDCTGTASSTNPTLCWP
ncbi:type IV pilin protein [Rhodoferax sp.]|uniref:type IV pilin protein n=1 Tax=Rhodoferax sp. TaxID=50421 RepID=UPI00374DEC54